MYILAHEHTHLIFGLAFRQKVQYHIRGKRGPSLKSRAVSIKRPVLAKLTLLDVLVA